jgi:hypothetical protein
MNPPFVSCVTVPRGSLARLKTAVQCYCQQTYPHRELLIAACRDPWRQRAVGDYVASLERNDVRVLRPADGDDSTAAALGAAGGDLACVWADSDVSHPSRLQHQVEHLTRAGLRGSVTGDRLAYLWPNRLLYWVDATDPATARAVGVAETLLARADEAPALWRRLQNEAVAPARLPAGGGLLSVRVFGDLLDPHAPSQDLLAAACRDQQDYRPFAGQLRAILSQFQLPRPFLVQGRTADGQTVTVDLNALR